MISLPLFLMVLILILIVVHFRSYWFPTKNGKDPHTSSLHIAFTEHITNALIKAREEKLKLKVSIPRKLEDGWDPMVKIKLNYFSFYLCDVGASASVLPKRMYDMLELKPF